MAHPYQLGLAGVIAQEGTVNVFGQRAFRVRQPMVMSCALPPAAAVLVLVLCSCTSALRS